MAERIVGIELREGVRAARLRVDPTRTRLEGVYELSAPGETDLRRLAALARELLEKNGLTRDRLVLGLPAEEAVARRLSFPFSSARKIAQVLPMELGARSPERRENVLTDFCFAARRPGEKRAVLAAAFPEEILLPILEVFEAAGVRPETVDLDLDGLYAAAADAMGPGATFLALQVDAARTGLVLGLADGPAVLRSIPMGALELAPADGGAPAPEVAQRFRREVLMALAPLAPPGEAGAFLLAGPGAGLGAVRRAVEGIFATKAVVLERLGQGLAATARPGEDLSSFAVPLGLALRGRDPESGLDFLRALPGRAARRGSSRPIRTAAWAALFVLAVFLAAQGTELAFKSRRLAELDNRNREIVKRVVGKDNPAWNDEQRASLVREKLRQLEEAASAARLTRGAGVVEVLRILSETAAQDAALTVASLTMTDKTARLRAETDSYDGVERLKNALSGSGAFQDVIIRGAKARGAGKGVDFELELVGNP